MGASKETISHMFVEERRIIEQTIQPFCFKKKYFSDESHKNKYFIVTEVELFSFYEMVKT